MGIKEECYMTIDKDEYIHNLSTEYIKMTAKTIVLKKLLEISKEYLDPNNPKTPKLIEEIDKELRDKGDGDESS